MSIIYAQAWIIWLIWLRGTLFSEVEGSGKESHSSSGSGNGRVEGGFHFDYVREPPVGIDYLAIGEHRGRSFGFHCVSHLDVERVGATNKRSLDAWIRPEYAARVLLGRGGGHSCEGSWRWFCFGLSLFKFAQGNDLGAKRCQVEG